MTAKRQVELTVERPAGWRPSAPALSGLARLLLNRARRQRPVAGPCAWKFFA
jgi:hypothetical protein